MRSILMSLTVTTALAWVAAGPALAQNSGTPQVVRGSSAESSKSSAAKAPAATTNNVQRAAATRSASPQRQTPQAQRRNAAKPEALRGSRYGGFAPAPSGPAPTLDTTSPRTLSLVNFNTQDVLTVTYWSNGAYHRQALDQLNQFLRDTRENQATEMDPLLFDVLWHTLQVTGFQGTVEVLSAYRSPTTNAWLASVSRGVARDSQHMNGNAMDVRFVGMPVFKMRQAARSLGMGGVGYYPRSGFVHLDTGPVRYW
jgi:hypothetical protein